MDTEEKRKNNHTHKKREIRGQGLGRKEGEVYSTHRREGHVN